MARTIQGIVTKHSLTKQPMVVINKAGGAGGEGFLDVKASQGNPHKIIITLSNLFTTPMATGIPFSWKDLTPVAMLALDEFVLWVNAEKPYKTAKEYTTPPRRRTAIQDGRHRLQAGRPDHHRGGGEGRPAPSSSTSRSGGGAVAVQLVGDHVDSTVNNPNEAISHWRGGSFGRSACSTPRSSTTTEKSPAAEPWSSIPTCKSAGLDIEYLMLRGIFMSPGATPDQVNYYVELFKKVRETRSGRS